MKLFLKRWTELFLIGYKCKHKLELLLDRNVNVRTQREREGERESSACRLTFRPNPGLGGYGPPLSLTSDLGGVVCDLWREVIIDSTGRLEGQSVRELEGSRTARERAELSLYMTQTPMSELCLVKAYHIFWNNPSVSCGICHLSRPLIWICISYNIILWGTVSK